MKKSTPNPFPLRSAGNSFYKLAHRRGNIWIVTMVVLVLVAGYMVIQVMGFINGAPTSPVADASVKSVFASRLQKVHGLSGLLGFLFLPASSQSDQTATTPPASQGVATASTDLDPGDARFLAAHPNPPLIYRVDGIKDPKVGDVLEFIFVVKDFQTEIGGKAIPAPFCYVGVQWGYNNDDPVTKPALCIASGTLDGLSQELLKKVAVKFAYPVGGQHILRAWVNGGPSAFITKIPEAQMLMKIGGSPSSPVVCNDSTGISEVIDPATSPAATMHYYDQSVNLGTFDVTADQSGWVTQALIMTQVQSNNFYWRQDFRRLTVVGPNGELGHISLFESNPADDAQGGSISPFDSNSAVGSTGTVSGGKVSPIVQLGMKINLSPFQIGAGQTVALSLVANVNSTAVNNNQWRVSIIGLTCNGGPNMFKGSLPYLYLDDPRYFQRTNGKLIFGNIFKVSGIISGSSKTAPNGAACPWGTYCAEMMSPNSGIFQTTRGGGTGTTTGGN